MRTELEGAFLKQKLDAICPGVQLARRLVSTGRDVFACPTLSQFEETFLKDYHPHRMQQKLHDNIDVRFVAICAGRRSGKTYGCAREFFRRIYRDVQVKKSQGKKWTHPFDRLSGDSKPFCRYYCTSPTYSLGNLQRQEIFEILGRDKKIILNYNENKGLLWLRGGVLIEFKSGDRPERLVGAGLDGIWDDESAREKPDLWKESLRAALSDNKGWALFSTTPLGKNWFYKHIWTKTQFGGEDHDSDYLGIHFKSSDNTFLPHLLEESEKARQELPNAVYLRNYEASFEAFDNKIFDEFVDDATHIVEALPPLKARWAGVDWGFSHAGTQVCVGVDLFDNIFVYSEDYVTELTITPPAGGDVDSWIRRYKRAAKNGVDHWFADPSQPVHIQTCRDHGLDFRRGDNNVSAGLDLLISLFKPVASRWGGELRPSIYIHKSCENLRNELSSYQWGPSDKPVKENDHAIDALRYAVYTEMVNGSALNNKKKELIDKFPSVFKGRF